MYRLSEHSLAHRDRSAQADLAPQRGRLCSQCQQREVETEKHFILRCKKYAIEKDIYFNKIAAKLLFIISLMMKNSPFSQERKGDV